MTTTFTRTELKMIAILAHQGAMARKEALEAGPIASGLSLDEALLAFTEIMFSEDILKKVHRMLEEANEVTRGKVARLPV